MAQKLWEKNFEVNKEIERFTVGRDRELDLYLAKYDVLGSMAHITMLESIGLLESDELHQLLAELRRIYGVAESGDFVIEEGVEDVHSQVELMLTQRLGDMGKKIHSGRSRNDQVLVDLKLFTRHELREVVDGVKLLFDELLQKSEQYKDVLMPGYTHLQVAMPSSFGLWFGAYAESLADDMLYLLAAWRMTNRNPLRLVVSAEPHDDHGAVRLRHDGLQRGLRTDGSRQDGAQRSVCPRHRGRHPGEARV